VNKEIARTWAFLFATGRDAEKKAAVYDKYTPLSGIPDEHRCFLKDLHLGQRYRPNFQAGLKRNYDQVLIAAAHKLPLPYSQFPLFETRLRQLRNYMDNEKPRGFRQLWKDNRDSLNYYTFWGVIILGGLSVALALFSLAVSVAQTVASFQALARSSASTSG